MNQSNGRDQVVVITGASAGVGRATAVAFAKHGARIGLLARGQNRLDDAAREVEAAGGKALAIPTDVASPEQIGSAAEKVQAEFGPVDFWINNVMTSVFSPVKEMKPEEYRRVTEVCYLGFVYGTLEALKTMLPRDRGVIVQVGSALAYRAIPLQSAYCASKHAIRGFTDSLRSELIHDGSNVQITAVHLPAINTPQFRWVKSRLPKKAQPVPPIYQPELAADAILWAAANPKREVFVAMSTTKAILGNKVIPKWLDHYLAKEAYEGQQTDEPEDPDRPDNLWEPHPGEFGAHGEFDDEAKSFSPQFWAVKNRKPLLLGGAGLLGVAALLFGNKRG